MPRKKKQPHKPLSKGKKLAKPLKKDTGNILAETGDINPTTMTAEEWLYSRMVKMTRRHCTRSEVKDFLGLTETKLREILTMFGHQSWRAFYQRHRSGGNYSLRRAQYISAVEDRNPSMLIFMGKQYLGQTDKRETTITHQERVTIDATKMTDEQLDAILEAGRIDALEDGDVFDAEDWEVED